MAMAATPDAGSQATTGTMTGSQQVGKPATGAASPSYTYPRSGNTGTGMSAQSTGPAYPGVVGPTGSRQPDATNPSRSSPSGGGQESGGGTGSASGGAAASH
jgi:hypothetical protein